MQWLPRSGKFVNNANVEASRALYCTLLQVGLQLPVRDEAIL